MATIFLNLTLSSISLLFIIVAPVVNASSSITLKEGPSKNLVLKHCQTCHSLDYIEMNSKFLGEKGWDAVVNKMVNAYGAPVPADDLPLIVKYLSSQY